MTPKGVEVIMSQAGGEVQIVDRGDLILQEKGQEMLAVVDRAEARVQGVVRLSGETARDTMPVNPVVGCLSVDHRTSVLHDRGRCRKPRRWILRNETAALSADNDM